MTYGDIYICTETNALTIVTPKVKSDNLTATERDWQRCMICSKLLVH